MIPKPAGRHEERRVIPKRYSSRIKHAEEVEIQYVIDSHAAGIIEYDREQPCGLSESEDEEHFDIVVHRLQLITTVLTVKPPGGG
jgi:hypothetical protein